MRVKQADIEHQIERLNNAIGVPNELSTKQPDGTFKRNPKVFYLAMAYGGYKLEQQCATGSGCRDVLNTGYTTKRELYQAIDCYMRGMDDGA